MITLGYFLPDQSRDTEADLTAARQQKRIHILTAVLCGIGLTFIFYRYTVLSGFDLVQADPGDSRLIASTLEHWFQVFRGINQWQSPPWFFPTPGTLGYADALFGMAVPYSAFRTFGAGTFLSMNFTLILLSFFSYLACLWLLRGVLEFRCLPSIIGAAFFSFNYPKFAMLHHIKLAFDVLQPIILGLLLSLLVIRDMPSQLSTFLRCLGASLLLALLACTTFLNAWFLFALLFLTLAIALLDCDLRDRILSLVRHRRVAACAGFIVGAVGLIPFMYLYLPVLAASGGWTWPEVLRNIPQPDQLIWMGTDNLAWGWLAVRWPHLDAANASEMRIGYGAVATLVWAGLVGFMAVQLVRSAPLIPKHEQPPHSIPRIVGALLLASLAMVLLASQIDGHSPWYLIYKFVPGGAGIRSVSRYVLTLSLPLAIAFAYALDSFLARPHSKTASAIIAVAVVTIAFEQLAEVKHMYSAHAAEQFDGSIASMVDRRCSAFYLKPTKNHPLAPKHIDVDTITEETFDAKAYLSANPDVAQYWKGSAWEHFITSGKYENRNLTPGLTSLDEYYQVTASIAALLAGVPTINGLTAKIPPGWYLLHIFGPSIPTRVEDWLRRNEHSGAVCLLERDLDGTEIPGRTSVGFFQTR